MLLSITLYSKKDVIPDYDISSIIKENNTNDRKRRLPTMKLKTEDFNFKNTPKKENTTYD